jgi:hypothetical protein
LHDRCEWFAEGRGIQGVCAVLLVNVDGFEFEEALAIADGTGTHFEAEKDLGVVSEWGWIQ